MRWIDAKQLSTWASERIDARSALPRLVGQLIRASVTDVTAFRFPSGDSAQIQGWDGQLVARPEGSFRTYIPEGSSVWEWGVAESPGTKAQSDWKKRKKNPGDGVNQAETTFVFVTPQTWPKSSTWVAKKKKEGSPWRDIRIIDGVALEEWCELCPAAAATFARENGFAPKEDVQDIDEFWESYASRFNPKLAEAVLLAGRAEQSQALLQTLSADTGIHRYRGDSLDEVLAFVAAVIRSADESQREYLRARTLVVQSENAARLLKARPNLIFAMRGEGVRYGGLLDDRCVIVPIGRDSTKQSSAITLARPLVHEMSEALCTMGIVEDKALKLAYGCGRSVSILARTIASADSERPAWRNSHHLIPAFLAGAWDQSSEADTAAVLALSGFSTYDDLEGSLRAFLALPDAPLETVGAVWAVRAPVDMFVHVAHLITNTDWARLKEAAKKVLSEVDPSLELPPGERAYARLRNKVLTHSSWLRDGITTTLLILAALGVENDTLINGGSPQDFVNQLVADIPGLRDDYRVIASLSAQLPMLMEASPVPLFLALEHLLEGDGTKLMPIFRDTKDQNWLFGSSPHTGLLWALEVAGQDPQLLPRAADILARLAEIDPGGTHSNRPLNSLRSLFLTWKPLTNASHEFRLAVIDALVAAHPEIGWKLLLVLMPKMLDTGFQSVSPHFRDAGASDRETLTWAILYKTITAIVSLAVRLAGTDPLRWESVLDSLGSLLPADRQLVIAGFSKSVSLMHEQDKERLWQHLADFVRRHKTYAGADWSLPSEELEPLERILEEIAPKNLETQDQYLFKEVFPDIPGVEPENLLTRTEELRKEVVARILRDGGVDRVVRFSSDVEAPRYVGAAFGLVGQDMATIMDGILAKNDSGKPDLGFSGATSSTAHQRFGEKWADLIRAEFAKGKLAESQLQELIEWWPHNRLTWDWIAGFGDDARKNFWERRRAWGIQATGKDFDDAIDNYLDAERPEFIIDALYQRANEISTPNLIRLLEEFEKRIAQNPRLLNDNVLDFKMKFIFKALQSRDDTSLEVVAGWEYRYLPLLRESWSTSDPNSALDRYLVRSPEFFVKVISNVFRGKADRGEPAEDISPQARARARTSLTLLESFSTIPGENGTSIDSLALDAWVQEARRLAKAADRLAITEQYIGKILSHGLADPEDKVWPHRAIRDGLETWKSPEIERGVVIGKLNSRGVTRRAPFDGGKQERALADSFREDASKVNAWPRTKLLLIGLAEHWKQSAEQEDRRVEEMRLRE
jgi:hypothetical protein